jgi:predicted nucleotidyltransferase
MVRKNEHMFDKVNITPLGLQILTFLARNPDKQFYIREIAKIMNKSVGGTHKTLKSLKEMDFIKENKSGKNIYYQINQMNPSIKNFKIFMTINELTTLVNKLKYISEKIILFGSCSNGEDTSDSDIDLLILTNEKEKVNKKILNTKFNRKIQAVVVNAGDLMKIKEKDKGFYQEINKGITLCDIKNE